MLKCHDIKLLKFDVAISYVYIFLACLCSLTPTRKEMLLLLFFTQNNFCQTSFTSHKLNYCSRTFKIFGSHLWFFNSVFLYVKLYVGIFCLYIYNAFRNTLYIPSSFQYD